MDHLIPYKSGLRHKIKGTFYTETKKIIRTLMITLGIMIVVLSSIFLFTVNENSQKGYLLTQEKIKNEELRSENSDINSKIIEETSFTDFEVSEKVKEMQTAENKLFVTEEDNKVN